MASIPLHPDRAASTRSRQRARRAASASFFACLAACGEAAQEPAPTGPGTPLVTLLDYFRQGEERVERFLAAGEPGAPSFAVVVAASECVARLRVIRELGEGGAFETTHATAALIDGRARAVTVAHALVGESDAAHIELVLGDGRVLAARARDLAHFDPRRPETDWAVLDVVDPPLGLDSFELGEARAGVRVVLGFLGRIGRLASGATALDHPGRSGPLAPLRVLYRAAEPRASRLELLAGAVPVGGMSGALCVSADGRLVALQRAVSEEQSGGVVRWTLEIVPLDGPRAELLR